MDLFKLLTPYASLLVTALLSFLAAQYWYRKKLRQEAVDRKAAKDDDLRREVADLKSQVGLLGQSVQTVNTVFQAALVKQLTHFHTPELDALLAKLAPFSLTEEEEEQMIVLLKERETSLNLNGSISDSERDAAAMIPYLVKRIRAEGSTIDFTLHDLKLVAVPTDHE